jgi:Dehydrogenase E1 component
MVATTPQTSEAQPTVMAAVPSDAEILRRMYRTMRLIRAFELKVETLRTSGRLQGSAHLYVGQEAVAAGVCAQLNADDYVASTHRGHGHAIAKGVDVARMKVRAAPCISPIRRSACSVPPASSVPEHRSHWVPRFPQKLAKHDRSPSRFSATVPWARVRSTNA